MRHKVFTFFEIYSKFIASVIIEPHQYWSLQKLGIYILLWFAGERIIFVSRYDCYICKIMQERVIIVT